MIFKKVIAIVLPLIIFLFNSAIGQYSCTTGIPITDGYTSASTVVTTGVNQWITSITTCGESNSYYNSTDLYVYTYTTTGAGESITATIEPNVDWMSLAVFSSCTGTTLSGCLSEAVTTGIEDLTVCATNLAAATTYYIVVSRWDTNGLNFDFTNFIVSDSDDIPSDECATAGAINLSQDFIGTTACSYTPSVGSPDIPPNSCGSIENDSWMEFTASDTDVEIDYNVFNCGNGNGVQLAVFSGSCSTLSLLTGSCVNPALGTGTWNFSGLTIGETYYIRIDGWGGDICTYAFTPVDGVAIIPPNDDCATATSLVCGAAAITGDILVATATDAPNGCGAFEEAGIWFTFTGDGGDYTINTTGADFETDLNVYYTTSGTPADYCNNLVCESSYTGTDQEASLTISTVNNRIYYVYLDGKSGAIGNYSIAMTCVSCDAQAGGWN